MASTNDRKTERSDLPSIFLSYARDDDEDFVRTLYKELTSKGFRVWWDRVSMPGRSLTFHQEIRDAIEAHDRTIVVLGKRAIESEYVRAEWQYALAADKVVTPVLRSGTYELVPTELKSLHCTDATKERDLKEALEEIVRIAKAPPPPVGRTFHVPKPPPHFRPRLDQFSGLAQRFSLSDPERIALSFDRRAVVLHGMGGLGKSVLAAALATATAIRRLFFGGVVWLSFGHDDKAVLDQLQDAGLALGDDTREYATERRASERLRQRLENAAVLLVLDNVWWDEQVHPFRSALGRRCQMLITTRDASLATRLGADDFALDPLSEEEALVLLADWVRSKSAELPMVAQEVAAECGCLPFALALAGAMVRDQTSWEDLLDALRSADLSFMRSSFPDYEYTDLLRAQQVSLEVLRRSDGPDLTQAADRYLEIAAFQWERPVSENALVTRWRSSSGLTGAKARQVLSTLAGKALVRTEGEPPNRQVYLHDLQQDFLAAHVQDPSEEHAAIVDAYAERYPGAPLAAENDGYYFENLFYHLEHAERIRDMHALLRRETEDGANAWWEARIALGQAFGYYADVRRAWAKAKAIAFANPAQPDADAVALLVRYALITGSIRNALAEVPVPLIRRLLSEGLWTAQQALAAARWHPNPSVRADGLAAVLPLLDDPVRQEVVEETLAMIRTFPEHGDQARSLVEIGARLADERRSQVLQEAVDLARADLPGNRSERLKRAWELEPERTEWLEEAIQTLEEMDLEISRRFAIESLVTVVPESKLDTLSSLARELDDPIHKAWALLTVARRLNEPERSKLAQEADEAASLSPPHIDVRHRAATARFLPKPQREQAALEVLGSFQDLRTPGARLQALADVAPLLTGEHRIQAEKALHEQLVGLKSSGDVHSFIEEGQRGEWLRREAPVLFQTLIEPLIAAVRRDDNDHWRAKAISALIPYLTADQVHTVLLEESRRAQLVDDQGNRVSCLTALCARLSETVREPIMDRILATLTIPGSRVLAPWQLFDVLRLATPSQLEHVRETTVSTREASEFAPALASAYAHHGSWDRVYEMLEQIQGTYHFGLALREFPEPVPPDVASAIIGGAIATQDAELAGKAISTLARFLEGEERRTALLLGLRALQYLTNPHDRCELVRELLPTLPSGLLGRVDLLGGQEDAISEIDRSSALARLALRWAQCGHLERAIDVLPQVTYEEDFSRTAVDLAMMSGGELRSRLLDSAESVAGGAWPSQGVSLLVYMSQQLGDPERTRLLDKATAMAEQISTEDKSFGFAATATEVKAEALLHVAPFLPEPRRGRLLLESWRLAPKGGSWSGTRVLKALPSHLASLRREDLLGPWHDYLDSASVSRQAVHNELEGLVDVLERLGGADTLEATVSAIEDAARWWPDAP